MANYSQILSKNSKHYSKAWNGIIDLSYPDGQSVSSYLTVEPFAVLFGLSALFLPAPDPARRPGIAPPLSAFPYMAMLTVRRYIINLRVGSMNPL